MEDIKNLTRNSQGIHRWWPHATCMRGKISWNPDLKQIYLMAFKLPSLKGRVNSNRSLVSHGLPLFDWIQLQDKEEAITLIVSWHVVTKSLCHYSNTYCIYISFIYLIFIVPCFRIWGDFPRFRVLGFGSFSVVPNRVIKLRKFLFKLITLYSGWFIHALDVWKIFDC